MIIGGGVIIPVYLGLQDKACTCKYQYAQTQGHGNDKIYTVSKICIISQKIKIKEMDLIN